MKLKEKLYDRFLSKLEIKRKEQKMTRKQLSLKSGISDRTIESYEQGYRELKKAKIETLIKLSNALNCKIEDII